MQAVSDKVRIHLRTADATQYRNFLPGQPGFEMLTDLACGYLGPLVDVEVAPTMPAGERPAMRIGQEGAIGHTSWMAPKTGKKDQNKHIESAIFSANSNNNHENDPEAVNA